MKNYDDHTGVLLEDIQDKLTRLSEALADVPSTVQELRYGVGQLKDDVKVIKAVVTDQSHQVTDHDKRLTNVEATVGDHAEQLRGLRQKAV